MKRVYRKYKDLRNGIVQLESDFSATSFSQKIRQDERAQDVNRVKIN